MSTRLVILGLLRDRPLYGYEIKHIIEEHMGDWTDIAFGSIYYALGKLEEKHFIEQVAVEQEGNRPSRSVYQITAAGEEEFLRLLRAVWTNVERRHFDLDLGLFFMNALPHSEVEGYLEQRVAQLQGVVRHLKEHEEQQLARDEVPAQAQAIFAHSRMHIEAELTWTHYVLEQFRQGAYD